MMKQGCWEEGCQAEMASSLIHTSIHLELSERAYQEADPALVNRIVEVKFTDRLILTEHIFQGTLWYSPY